MGSVEMKVIVYGTALLAKRWAELNKVDPKDVYLATQPATLQMVEGPFQIVRYANEVWKPPTSACERRVRLTDEHIKRDKQLREKAVRAANRVSMKGVK